MFRWNIRFFCTVIFFCFADGRRFPAGTDGSTGYGKQSHRNHPIYRRRANHRQTAGAGQTAGKPQPGGQPANPQPAQEKLPAQGKTPTNPQPAQDRLPANPQPAQEKLPAQGRLPQPENLRHRADYCSRQATGAGQTTGKPQPAKHRQTRSRRRRNCRRRAKHRQTRSRRRRNCRRRANHRQATGAGQTAGKPATQGNPNR